jgi:hypothetical protein
MDINKLRELALYLYGGVSQYENGGGPGDPPKLPAGFVGSPIFTEAMRSSADTGKYKSLDEITDAFAAGEIKPEDYDAARADFKMRERRPTVGWGELPQETQDQAIRDYYDSVYWNLERRADRTYEGDKKFDQQLKDLDTYLFQRRGDGLGLKTHTAFRDPVSGEKVGGDWRPKPAPGSDDALRKSYQDAIDTGVSHEEAVKQITDSYGVFDVGLLNTVPIEKYGGLFKYHEGGRHPNTQDPRAPYMQEMGYSEELYANDPVIREEVDKYVSRAPYMQEMGYSEELYANNPVIQAEVDDWTKANPNRYIGDEEFGNRLSLKEATNIFSGVNPYGVSMGEDFHRAGAQFAKGKRGAGALSLGTGLLDMSRSFLTGMGAQRRWDEGYDWYDEKMKRTRYSPVGQSQQGYLGDQANAEYGGLFAQNGIKELRDGGCFDCGGMKKYQGGGPMNPNMMGAQQPPSLKDDPRFQPGEYIEFEYGGKMHKGVIKSNDGESIELK